MAGTTIRRRPGGGRPTAPTRSDGAPYRYEMLHGGQAKRTYSDDLAELVAALIPGYAEIQDPVELVRARIAHAVHVQVTMQAVINVGMDTAECSPREREVLSGDRAVPPVVAEWRAPVPLILLDCFYAPVTDVPRPVAVAPGEILWLRPATDADLLRSLAGLGVVVLSERSAGSAAYSAGADD